MCVYSMIVCVCVIWKYGCVYQMKTRVPFCEQLRKRFDGKESSCKGSVRFSILCVRFSVMCVQFWESRYCSEKRVLTIVKNCKSMDIRTAWWSGRLWNTSVPLIVNPSSIVTIKGKAYQAKTDVIKIKIIVFINNSKIIEPMLMNILVLYFMYAK